MFNLGGVVNALSASALTISRQSGSYTAGEWSQSESSTLSVLASVQPLSGTQIQRLPEGSRAEAMVRLWTPVSLVTTKEGGTSADQFPWDNDTYIVQEREAWSELGGYYAYLARKAIS